MRTLKKTLSLVLALVLCFGLVGTAFAANVDAYTDAADLGAAYAEAAEVMMGLGIIKGMSDTELGATGTLTREQAAKIVVYLMVGGTVADMLKADKAPFKDVAADRWSAGYIAYCADKGILAGYGDGNFGPADELTGFQFAKMLLAALGYGKLNEFAPESWSINTATLAFNAENNLFKGDAKAATHEAISRQQAMLMAFNALYAQPKAFVKLTEEYADKGTDFATDVHSLAAPYYAVVTGNASTGVSALVGTNIQKATVTAGKITALAAESSIKVATDAALIGKIVRVYEAGTPAAVISVDEVSTDVVVATAIDNAVALKAAFGATLPAVAGASYSVDGAKAVTANVTAYDASANAAVGTYVKFGGEVVGYIAPAAVTTTTVGAIVTTAGSESIALTGVGAINNKATDDDIVEYAGIKTGDIVTYTVAGGVYTVVKAETVEGKITKKAGTTLTVNGKDYKAFAGTDNASVTGEVAYDAATYADNYKLYLAPDGTYFALVVANADTSVAAGIVYPTFKYTKAVAATTDAYGNPLTPAATLYFVQAVDSTGAEVNYQVTETEYNSITVKNLYTVKTDYNNTLKATVADLTAVTAGTTTGGISAPASKTVAANDIKIADNYYFADGVKFIYVSGTGADLKVTVKDGKQVIGSATNVVYYGTKVATAANYDVQYVFVDAAFVADNTGAGVMAGFEAANSTTTVPYTTALGTTAEAFVHTVYIDGVKTEILTTSATKITGFSAYTYDAATGLYTVGAEYTYVKSGKITNNYNGKISSGATFADLDVSNAKIVNVLAPTDADYAKVATTGAALTTCETVSVVTTNLGVATVVYVTDYTPAA